MGDIITLELHIGCWTVVIAWQKFHCCSSGPSMQIIQAISDEWLKSFALQDDWLPPHQLLFCTASRSDISVIYVSLVCISLQFDFSELSPEMIILMPWQGKCFSYSILTKCIFRGGLTPFVPSYSRLFFSFVSNIWEFSWDLLKFIFLSFQCGIKEFTLPISKPQCFLILFQIVWVANGIDEAGEPFKVWMSTGIASLWWVAQLK